MSANSFAPKAFAPNHTPLDKKKIRDAQKELTLKLVKSSRKRKVYVVQPPPKLK